MQEHTKRTLLIALMVVSALPAVFLIHTPTLVSVSTVSLYASAIFGYIGIVLLIWMTILGAKGVMGIFFTDLAPVLRIHKWLGKYGTLAIFMHPLLVTIGYGESALYSFIPLISTWSQRHILLGQIAFWILLLTWIVSALVRNKLSWRAWKYLHYLAYICIPFALLHVPDLGSQQRAYPFVNAYFFMLVAAFAIVTLIRLVSLFNLDRAKYRIARHIQLTPEDYMMRLEPIGTRRLMPRFGQYVYVKLGFISEDHPFSVTQYDVTTGAITITYRLAGMYTQELSRVPEQSTVLLSGPYGTFMSDIEDDDAPIVYIAGGIGVTPFVGPIMKDGAEREQWLFTANRTRDLAVLGKPLKGVLAKRAISVYSREETARAEDEEIGYVSEAILRKHLGDLSNYKFYLCGPAAMLASMHHMLASAGVASERVKSEEFGW